MTKQTTQTISERLQQLFKLGFIFDLNSRKFTSIKKQNISYSSLEEKNIKEWEKLIKTLKK